MRFIVFFFFSEEPGAIVGFFFGSLFAICVIVFIFCACKKQPGGLGRVLARRRSRVDAKGTGTITTHTTTTTLGKQHCCLFNM